MVEVPLIDQLSGTDSAHYSYHITFKNDVKISDFTLVDALNGYNISNITIPPDGEGHVAYIGLTGSSNNPSQRVGYVIINPSAYTAIGDTDPQTQFYVKVLVGDTSEEVEDDTTSTTSIHDYL